MKTGSMENRQKIQGQYISLIVSKIQTSVSFPLLWKPHKMSHSGMGNATYLPCGGSKFNTTCFCVPGVPLHQ